MFPSKLEITLIFGKIRFLEKYYEAWNNYPSDLKLEINYNELWDSAKNIKNFLNINSLEFIDKFPKYKPYNY